MCRHQGRLARAVHGDRQILRRPAGHVRRPVHDDRVPRAKLDARQRNSRVDPLAEIRIVDAPLHAAEVHLPGESIHIRIAPPHTGRELNRVHGGLVVLRDVEGE